jgi:catechol 2,3-dioxygenase-like lactoylglutathione lyase family enzyme
MMLVAMEQRVSLVTLGVSDLARAKAFYELVAPHAGFGLSHASDERVQFAGGSGSFSLVAGADPTERLHLAFPVTEDGVVQAFHRAAVDAGYTDNGAPGERAEYHPGYYGAFVLDPDGNNVEAVHHTF